MIVEMLLAAGARVNARSHLGGWTPLQVAERDGDTGEVAAGTAGGWRGSHTTVRQHDVRSVI